jgi:hypothetical protein
MTLSPVFRSAKAVTLLEEQGIWEKFGPALARQAEAVQTVYDDFAGVIGERFRLTPEAAAQKAAEQRPAESDSRGELGFLQDYFFLTLFLALFESLGVDPARLPFYGELDFCIMGTITAADNLFDDQAKSLLPLRPVAGARYQSILQLMSFERLLRAVGDRAVAARLFGAAEFAESQRALLDQMAEIGLLEGSEEGGVNEIPTPEAMIDKVHRVRGGMLFGLAFAAPHILERGAVGERLRAAEPAIARLGTAFQIVDDLTDFEFDLTRHSHNLLVSRIHHHGTAEERATLQRLWDGSATAEQGMVEGLFAESARQVLNYTRTEAREAFAKLAELGFWFPAPLADEVVHAIVGLDGVARMQALTGEE